MELSEKTKRNFFILLWAGFLIPVIAAFVILFMIGTDNLGYVPDFEELENPKSSLASQIISADRVLLGKFYKENRTTENRFNNIPDNIKAALLATEDVRFYEHYGIDLQSLFRVAKGLVTRNTSSGGGSTISQQLAKNLYNMRDHKRPKGLMGKIVMKLQEWVTAVKLERRYCKEEIMSMYLNTVGFGHNAFGIEAAAKTFFDTKPENLKLEEASVLVGLLKAPTKYSPKSNPKNSKNRRNTVLSQIEKYQTDLKKVVENYKMLSHSEFESLKATDIVLHFSQDTHVEGLAPYFREFLRTTMTAKKPERSKYASWQEDIYKEDSTMWANNPLYGWCNKNLKANGENYDIYNDGLKIYVTIDSRMQKYAEEAVREHMGTGYMLGNQKQEGLQSVFERLEIQKHKNNRPFSARISEAQIKQIMNQSVKRTERWRVGSKVDKLDSVTIMKQFMTPTNMRVFTWQHPEGVDTVMTPWDSILYYKKFLRCGMMSMEPESGHVKAYVGGIDYHYFQYDHVSLGRRQVGSTFKPFVYAAMFLNHREIQPNHLVANVEYTIDNPGGIPPVYTPKFSQSSKDGQMIRLSVGLGLSLNQISAWCMKQTSPKTVLELVKKLGVISPIPEAPSICVGSAEVKLKEMVAAYCGFANNGFSTSPVFVTKIEDKNGNVVSTFQSVHEQAMEDIEAYKMVEMLRVVTHGGTASRATGSYGFGITADCGGKTGTTNLNADGWFMGITPRLVSGVWTGGEERSIQFSRGDWGQGSRLALPVWCLYMKKIYADPELSKDYPVELRFEIPEDYSKYVDESNATQNTGTNLESTIDSEEYNGKFNEFNEFNEGDY
ncbi:MAG: transglycosylase domain-containing protein [Bacteroidales bacterium]|nr:transglycosylase domain-containing protein [Bacteroidales bacterium]